MRHKFEFFLNKVQQRLADVGTGKPGGIVLAVSAIGLIFGVTVIVVFYCLMRCYVTVERKRVFGARRKFGRIPSEAHRPPHPDDCEEFEFNPDKASDEEEPPAFVFGQSSNAQMGGFQFGQSSNDHINNGYSISHLFSIL